MRGWLPNFTQIREYHINSKETNTCNAFQCQSVTYFDALAFFALGLLSLASFLPLVFFSAGFVS